MDFGQFLGNDTLKAQLSAAIDAQRLTHCYLLSGPKGSGKHTLAQLLMAAMECTADQRPCGRCSQCRKALQGIHPDIAVVDDTSRKTIPVDLIRQVCSDAYIRPNEGRRKIYLLPRAQDLGLPGQNALLKILEEPPEAVTFLLLCENALTRSCTALSFSAGVAAVSSGRPARSASLMTASCEKYLQPTPRSVDHSSAMACSFRSTGAKASSLNHPRTLPCRST